MNRKEQQLQEFRVRWMRWLGQKTRINKDYWTTLLNTNFCGWAEKTLSKHDINLPWLEISSSRAEVKIYYIEAIKCADMIDLCGLDQLYVNDKYGL